ncbi:MAG: hypothetical protein OXG05_13870 [Gammaproteobacteria bacterium]|nr:hypothetical protein [Gammaproteobacteria bacterium]
MSDTPTTPPTAISERVKRLENHINTLQGESFAASWALTQLATWFFASAGDDAKDTFIQAIDTYLKSASPIRTNEESLRFQGTAAFLGDIRDRLVASPNRST